MARDSQIPQIKICGLVRVEDAREAAACGVDAIGLVFYGPSPRHVEVAQAQAICQALPSSIGRVGLFVNAEAQEVSQIAKQVPLTVLQFHGEESAAYCEGFERAYWKAVRVREELDIELAMEQFPSAAGLLLDAWDEGKPGGTGKPFDWGLLDSLPDRKRLILAGGLRPDNVAKAIRRSRPAWVDVSSGVEEAPGRKNAALMREFVEAVRNA